MKILFASIFLLALFVRYSDLTEQLSQDMKINYLRKNKFTSRKPVEVSRDLKKYFEPYQENIEKVTKGNITAYVFLDAQQQLSKLYISHPTGTLYYSFGKEEVMRKFNLRKEREKGLKSQLMEILSELR